MRIIAPAVKKGDKYVLIPHLGRAPRFAVVDISEDGSYKISEVRNPYVTAEHGKGWLITKLFTELKVDAVVTQNIGPGMIRHLYDLGTDIYLVDVNDLEDIIKKILNHEISPVPLETLEKISHHHHKGQRRYGR